MCDAGDFVNWEDLDLDELLGDYTDDDFYSDAVNSDSSTDVSADAENVNPETAVAAVNPSTVAGNLQTKLRKKFDSIWFVDFC